MLSLPPSRMAPEWDSASAARLSNRMVAACGLPTTLRAAQVFVSPYPPKPRQLKTHEVASAVFIFHEVAAMRAVIPGAREATMVSIIGTIFAPSYERCPREKRPRKGIASHALK